MVRRYNRDEHVSDRLTWDAIRSGEPIIVSAGQTVVLPAGEPVMAGYPAALHVIRRAQESAFSDEEISSLRAWAVETSPQLTTGRVLVLDESLSPLVGATAWAELNEELRNEIAEYARTRFGDLTDAEPTLTDRRTHAAGGAKRQAVRYVFSRESAAHPGQSGVIVCLQPNVDEWAALSPAAVPSHGELGRFLLALHFMRANAGKNVTLNDVADSVGLSPFHFHRRFVDLTGMAPKQYLFDCQIADAQNLLLEGKLELYAIARQTGFAHQSHFTSRFRQATGMTPTRWRKAVLEAQTA